MKILSNQRGSWVVIAAATWASVVMFLIAFATDAAFAVQARVTLDSALLAALRSAARQLSPAQLPPGTAPSIDPIRAQAMFQQVLGDNTSAPTFRACQTVNWNVAIPNHVTATVTCFPNFPFSFPGSEIPLSATAQVELTSALSSSSSVPHDPPSPWRALFRPNPAPIGARVQVWVFGPVEPDVTIDPPSPFLAIWSGVDYSQINDITVLRPAGKGVYMGSIQVPNSPQFPVGLYSFDFVPWYGAPFVGTLAVGDAQTLIEPVTTASW